MSGFGNRILTTTREKLMPKVVDTILNSNVFTTRMLAKAKEWSGERMSFPIKFAKNTLGGSFAGYDTFSTQAVNNRVKALFYPKFYEIPVSLPLDEISVNATPERVLNLMQIELAGAAQDAADDIGTLLMGDGTGNAGKNFNGLANLVDDGTVASTIGGLDRSTYPTLKSYRAAAADTKLTLDRMAAAWNGVTSGTQKPTVIITTEEVFSLYEKLLTPMQRINMNASLTAEGLKGGTGFTGLDYKGVPVLKDEKCSAGFMYFLNENFLNFYALPMAETERINYNAKEIEGNDYGSSVPGLGFSWSNWIKPVNSASLVSHIYLGGELICENPKRQGVITGLSTV
jgi:hypothetical protein